MTDTAVVINSPVKGLARIFYDADVYIAQKTEELTALTSVEAMTRLEALQRTDFYTEEHLHILFRKADKSESVTGYYKLTSLESARRLIDFLSESNDTLDTEKVSWFFGRLDLNEEDLEKLFKEYPAVARKLSSYALQKYAESSKRLARHILGTPELCKLIDEDKYGRYKIYQKHQASLWLCERAFKFGLQTDVEDVSKSADYLENDVLRPRPRNWQAINTLVATRTRLEQERDELEKKLINLNLYLDAVKSFEHAKTPADKETARLWVESRKVKFPLVPAVAKRIQREIRSTIQAEAEKQQEIDATLESLRKTCTKAKLGKHTLDIFLRRQSNLEQRNQSKENLADLMKMQPNYMTLIDESHIEAMFALVKDADEFKFVFAYLASSLSTRDALFRFLCNARANIELQLNPAVLQHRAYASVLRYVYTEGQLFREENENGQQFLSNYPRLCAALYTAQHKRFAKHINLITNSDDRLHFLHINRHTMSGAHLFKLTKKITDPKERKKVFKDGNKDAENNSALDKLRTSIDDLILSGIPFEERVVVNRVLSISDNAINQRPLTVPNHRLLLKILSQDDIRGWVDVSRARSNITNNMISMWLRRSLPSETNIYNDDVAKIVVLDKRMLSAIRPMSVADKESSSYLFAADYVLTQIAAQDLWFESRRKDAFIQFFIANFINSASSDHGPQNTQAIFWYVANDKDLWERLLKAYVRTPGWLWGPSAQDEAIDKQNLARVSEHFAAKLNLSIVARDQQARREVQISEPPAGGGSLPVVQSSAPVGGGALAVQAPASVQVLPAKQQAAPDLDAMSITGLVGVIVEADADQQKLLTDGLLRKIIDAKTAMILFKAEPKLFVAGLFIKHDELAEHLLSDAALDPMVVFDILSLKEDKPDFLKKHKTRWESLLENSKFTSLLTPALLQALLTAGVSQNLDKIYAHNKSLVAQRREECMRKRNYPIDLTNHWLLYQPLYEENVSEKELTALLQIQNSDCVRWLQQYYAEKPAEIDAQFSKLDRTHVSRHIEIFGKLVTDKFIESGDIKELAKFFSPEGKTSASVATFLQKYFSVEFVYASQFLKTAECDEAIVRQNVSMFLKALEAPITLGEGELIKLYRTNDLQVMRTLFSDRYFLTIVSPRLNVFNPTAEQLEILIQMMLNKNGEGKHILERLKHRDPPKLANVLAVYILERCKDFNTHKDMLLKLFRLAETRELFVEADENTIAALAAIADQEIATAVVATFKNRLMFKRFLLVATYNQNILLATNEFILAVLNDEELRYELLVKGRSAEEQQQQLFALYNRGSQPIIDKLLLLHANNASGFNLNLLSGEQLFALYSKGVFSEDVKTELYTNENLRNKFIKLLADAECKFFFDLLMKADAALIAVFFKDNTNIQWLQNVSYLMPLLTHNRHFAKHVLMDPSLRKTLSLTDDHFHYVIGLMSPAQRTEFLTGWKDREFLSDVFVQAVLHGHRDKIDLFFKHEEMRSFDEKRFKGTTLGENIVVLPWLKAFKNQYKQRLAHYFPGILSDSSLHAPQAKGGIADTFNKVSPIKIHTNLSPPTIEKEIKKLQKQLIEAKGDKISLYIKLLTACYEFRVLNKNAQHEAEADTKRNFFKAIGGIKELLSCCLDKEVKAPQAVFLILEGQPLTGQPFEQYRIQFMLDPIMCPLLAPDNIKTLIVTYPRYAMFCLTHSHTLDVLAKDPRVLFEIARENGIATTNKEIAEVLLRLEPIASDDRFNMLRKTLKIETDEPPATEKSAPLLTGSANAAATFGLMPLTASPAASGAPRVFVDSGNRSPLSPPGK